MTSRISYEVYGGTPLGTARPDTLWCELVRVFVPDKSRETGDDDPYGVNIIELKPDNSPQLWLLCNSGFEELTHVAELVGDGATVWVRREP